MTDLSNRFEEIVAAAGRQSLLVFPGFVDEDLPSVWWQGNPDDWPDFLGIAKAEGARTLFVGRAILEHLIAEAKARKMRSLWLETGSSSAVLPALRLYASAGFVRCAAFDGYSADSFSVFMTKQIRSHRPQVVNRPGRSPEQS